MSIGREHRLLRGGLIAAIVLLTANLVTLSLKVYAAVPTVTATKRDSYPSHTSGKAQPGDTVSYTTSISNASSDATGVSFSDPLDANTTYVPGSLESTPIARNDSYHATGNIRITVPTLSGVLEVMRTIDYRSSLPQQLQAIIDAAEPFRSTNGYGLFRVMTRERNEIIIEGSDDGVTWSELRVLLHHPLDVLDHDDRIIDDNPDREHDREQGHGIGGISDRV